MINHFNIKKIRNYIIIFVLFFAFSSKANATNDFVCDYAIPMQTPMQKESTNASYYYNIKYRLKYKNGHTFVSFYNKDENKEYSGTEQIFEKKGLVLTRDNSAAFLSPVQFVNQNKYCPDELYYSSSENVDGKYNTIIFFTDKSYLNNVECSSSGGTTGGVYCGSVLPESRTDSKPSSNHNPDTDYVNCKYALVSSVENNNSGTQGVAVKNDLEITYNYKTGKYVTIKWDEVPDIKPHYSIDWLSYNGKCPSVLYTDNSVQSAPPHYIYDNASLVDQNTLQKFGLVKQINILQDTDNSGKTGCAALGGLTKYIRIFYNLFRFLAPVIIIVFSIIDFVGVVISGANEKLEKAKKRFITRLIIAVSWLLLPAILGFLLRLAGILDWKESLIDIVLC